MYKLLVFPVLTFTNSTLQGGNKTKATPEVNQVEIHSDFLNGSDNLHLDDDNGNEAEPALRTCTEKDCLGDASVVDPSRPLKKAKSSVDDECCVADNNNG